MSREIKFRVIRGNKIVGYERINKGEWEWMCPDLNPDTGERWNLGVMNLTYRSDEYKRNQFTGLKDKIGKEIYEGDIMQSAWDTMLLNWRIDFEDGGFVAINIGIDGYDGGKRYKLEQSLTIERVIVGNIHQDKHLLS